MVSWEELSEVAFRYRAGIAESSYEKLNSSLSRRSKLRIFQSVFLSTLTYELEALTLQDKFLKRIDAYACMTNNTSSSSRFSKPTTKTPLKTLLSILVTRIESRRQDEEGVVLDRSHYILRDSSKHAGTIP